MAAAFSAASVQPVCDSSMGFALVVGVVFGWHRARRAVKNQAQTANGTAVLRIEYSDGSVGTLGIGCHGPGRRMGSSRGL
jgi:hypothetical protein